MSNSEYDNLGSAFSGDSHRTGSLAHVEESPPDQVAESYYAPRADAVFCPRARAKTTGVKPSIRVTQILQAPDCAALEQDDAEQVSLLQPSIVQSFSNTSPETKTSHPVRRATDLNGAPETALIQRDVDDVLRAAQTPYNEYSKNVQTIEVASNDIPSNDIPSNDTASSSDSATPIRDHVSKPTRASSRATPTHSISRIEYFLEHILLRHFIQPPQLQAGQWREEQREEAYNQQTLELFRLRLQLMTGIVMAMLLFHTLFYIYLSPNNAPTHSAMYAALIVVCVSTRRIAQTTSCVDAVRKLCFWCYALFSLGGAFIVGVVGSGQTFILGGHNHIMLTTLLLPFAAADCFFIGSMVISSLAVSGFLTFIPHQRELYLSQIFMLCTTTAFTVFVAYFQNALRRRAFDSAFDAMCSMARYQNMSLRDTLTGGNNRRFLMQTLETEIERATRFSRPISLILFDLDNFKGVNDTLGHAAGDQVLVEMWHAATKAVRNVDTPARYGGDEFAIVLPEAAEDAAHEVASRLRNTASTQLLHRFGADSPQSKVTLSIGIVTLRPDDFISAEQLLVMADTQLYAAKKSGKNRIASIK